MWFLTTVFLMAAGLCVFVALKSRTRHYERSSAFKTAAYCATEVTGSSRSQGRGKTSEGRTPAEPPKQWWETFDSEYFWVVLCKNQKFHARQSPGQSHRIPLGHTDTFSEKPITVRFRVRCDSCAKEYDYSPSEVLRWEMDAPQSFDPHPLFRD